MKDKRIWLILLALLQVAAPLYIAWRWEDVLQTGAVYRFRTMPVDPGDVLRGRYLSLAFQENQAPAGEGVKSDTEAYACLRLNAAGEAEVYRVVAERPPDVPYVLVEVYASYQGTAHFHMPFRRYYVNEADAPLLEKRYLKKADHVTAHVRVKDGYGVLESLEGLE